jgi:hypothetical protein
MRKAAHPSKTGFMMAGISIIINEQRFSRSKPLLIALTKLQQSGLLFIIFAALITYCTGSLACRLTRCLAFTASTFNHTVLH